MGLARLLLIVYILIVHARLQLRLPLLLHYNLQVKQQLYQELTA